MRLTVRLMSAAAMLVLATAGLADNTLSVTARIVGSVLLTLESAAPTSSDGGTATLTTALGTMPSHAAPAGFTLVRDGNQSTLSATIQARALKANMTSTSYALTARLLHALPSGVTWKLNGITLSESNAAVVVPAGEFATTEILSWEIMATAAAGNAAIDDTILFTVVPK